VTGRRHSRSVRELALLWCAATLGTLALTPLWPTLTSLLRPCAFRALTGLPCPTCGTTRAALAVLRIDLGAAWAVNPLATVAFLGFLAGGLVAPVWVWAGGPLPRLSPRAWRVAAFVLLLAALANWGYLLLSG
jgi:hypothetical protein